MDRTIVFFVFAYLDASCELLKLSHVLALYLHFLRKTLIF